MHVNPFGYYSGGSNSLSRRIHRRIGRRENTTNDWENVQPRIQNIIKESNVKQKQNKTNQQTKMKTQRTQYASHCIPNYKINDTWHRKFVDFHMISSSCQCFFFQLIFFFRISYPVESFLVWCEIERIGGVENKNHTSQRAKEAKKKFNTIKMIRSTFYVCRTWTFFFAFWFEVRKLRQKDKKKKEREKRIHTKSVWLKPYKSQSVLQFYLYVGTRME